jgi:hypothetical protein
MPVSLLSRHVSSRVSPSVSLGVALLFEAIARAIPTDAAEFALTVDARDEAAARFCRHLAPRRRPRCA